MRLAVFASGSGSNFQAILTAIQKGEFDAELALLVCDRADAYALERAKKFQVPVFVFNPKDFQNKQAFEMEILKHLREASVDFLVLAGYMRLVGQTLLRAYENKIVNIHPSLLPAFPGKDAIEQAYRAKVKVTGVTVHYVDEGMDTGPIIDQHPIYIEEHDTIETLREKIQAVEHQLYPVVLKKILGGHYTYETSINQCLR